MRSHHRDDDAKSEIGKVEHDRFTGLHFLIVRVDPGTAGVTIDYCPWCGANLRPLN